LTKCFKFFDIHNKGAVSFDQFFRAVEKIGIIIDKQVCFMILFKIMAFRIAKYFSITTTLTRMGHLITKNFPLFSAGNIQATLMPLLNEAARYHIEQREILKMAIIQMASDQLQ
jgi:hypothetical protein